MKLDFDKHRDVWGPLFSAQMDLWAKNVFVPALDAIEKGTLMLDEEGALPEVIEVDRPVFLFSERGIELELLDVTPDDYREVVLWDMIAPEYEMATHRFKMPVTQQAFQLIQPFISENARVLDCACGSGYEAIALSMIAKNGEVIACDLSREMIRMANRNAKQNEVKNMAFYQADARNLPQRFYNRFDVIFCQLSIGYFGSLAVIAEQFSGVLKENGHVFLIDAYPNLVNGLSIDGHKAANPQFERLYDHREIKEIFSVAGFNGFYWKEILPGIGVSMITKRK